MSKHCAIDLATKIAVIDIIEAGTRSKTDIAKSFSMPKSTLSTILKEVLHVSMCHNTCTCDVMITSSFWLIQTPVKNNNI